MDFKKILGKKYRDDMTSEELVEALSEVELEYVSKDKKDDEIKRIKDALDKANSEAASYKKQLREKQSEDEIKKAEEKAAREKLQSDYEALLKESQINKYKSDYLEMGYDVKLAQSTAEAFAEGDMAKVFKNHKTHLDQFEKQIKAKLIDATPGPEGGNSNNTVTKEQFDAMDYDQREEFYQSNQDLYEKYISE